MSLPYNTAINLIRDGFHASTMPRLDEVALKDMEPITCGLFWAIRAFVPPGESARFPSGDALGSAAPTTPARRSPTDGPDALAIVRHFRSFGISYNYL